MCMMLIQCFGRMNLGSCHAAQNADIPQPCDALLAVLVGGVALSLDERGFGHIAQLVVPCDALLVVLFVLLSFYQGRSSRISSQVPVSDLGE